MTREYHVFSQGCIEHPAFPSTRKILGERKPSTALLVNLLILFEMKEWKDSIVAILNIPLVQVGAVKDTLLVDPLLHQDYRKTIRFEDRIASDLPNADKRPGAKQRDEIVSKFLKEPDAIWDKGRKNRLEKFSQGG